MENFIALKNSTNGHQHSSIFIIHLLCNDGSKCTAGVDGVSIDRTVIICHYTCCLEYILLPNWTKLNFLWTNVSLLVSYNILSCDIRHLSYCSVQENCMSFNLWDWMHNWTDVAEKSKNYHFLRVLGCSFYNFCKYYALLVSWANSVAMSLRRSWWSAVQCTSGYNAFCPGQSQHVWDFEGNMRRTAFSFFLWSFRMNSNQSITLSNYSIVLMLTISYPIQKLIIAIRVLPF